MRSIFLSAALLPLLIAGPSHAEDALTGFQMPSKNVACIYSHYDGKSVLRCDIGDMEAKPPRPAGCEQEWGHSFEMEMKGDAGRVCTGDTLIDPSLPMLGYGEVWQRGGFTCRSEQAGLTCFNAIQHGFTLSRARQDVF
jgi:hypothetical protein